jgi:hypothetical protein
MSRAGELLRWYNEQDEDDELLQGDAEEEEIEIPDKGMKVKDYIKKEKQSAKKRGEVVDDDPDVIDKDDDDQAKSAKVAHHIDRTSGETKEGEIKNYAFPVEGDKKK